MKILFLVPYPLKESPSQRFRFEQYFGILLSAGHSYEVQTFLGTGTGKVLFEKGKTVQKVFTILLGFVRRFFLLFRVPDFDIVFIHREATPIGPPIIEWVIAKILRKKIVFDFDDAIWLSDRASEPAWLTAIKWRTKVKYICKWSYKVSCGNEYLCGYARQFNQHVISNPSTIDTSGLHNQDAFRKKSQEMVVGWTGSHSTLKYLYELEPILKQLEERCPQIKILVIADQLPRLSLASLSYLRWSPETEIEDLAKMDIGIMPLPDDEWSKGKCGFKALQYMSLGKPALVSPVGVNTKIVDHGITGYHCSTADDWLNRIEYLLKRRDVCDDMGRKGREKVINHYSVVSNTPNFLSLFE